MGSLHYYRHQRLHAPILFAVIVGGLAGGCARTSTVSVKGRILQNNQPLAVGKGLFQVILYPHPDFKEDKPYSSYPALTAENGTFEIAAIPPGEYLISIELLDPPNFTDRFQGSLRGAQSPIIRQVTGAEALVIDLPQK